MAATRASLSADLRALGVSAGMSLEVHASLRSLGPLDPDPGALLEHSATPSAPRGL